ncbi:hypothetical protein D3C76_1823100 [compost metagenome]
MLLAEYLARLSIAVSKLSTPLTLYHVSEVPASMDKLMVDRGFDPRIAAFFSSNIKQFVKNLAALSFIKS